MQTALNTTCRQGQQCERLAQQRLLHYLSTARHESSEPGKDRRSMVWTLHTCPALGKSSITSVRISMAVLAGADEVESLSKLPKPTLTLKQHY